MQLRPGILTEIVTVLALTLAPMARAESIFSLHLGYDNHPRYDRYYHNYRPDYFWNCYWPSFYFPAFYGNYYPFNYIYYPAYYHSYWFYPLVNPYYYTNYYPWYAYPYFYPYSGGHHHHDHDHDHDRYYSLAPFQDQNQHEQHSGYAQNVDKQEQGGHQSLHTGDKQTPVTTFRESTIANVGTGGGSMHDVDNGKPDVSHEDKNIKILNIKQAVSAPIVNSSSAAGTVRFISGGGATMQKTDGATMPGQRNGTAPINYSVPDRGHGYTNYRQPALRQSFVGMEKDNRQPSVRQQFTIVTGVTSQRPRVSRQSSATDGMQQQSSPRRHQDGRNDQQQAGESSLDRRARP